MAEHFKIIGKVNVVETLKYFGPIIEKMKVEQLHQYGLKGRIDDTEYEYGEGRAKLDVDFSNWNTWRDESYNTGWMVNFLNLFTDQVVGRIRVMRLAPRRCYSWHADPSIRIHVPIITSEDNLMVIGKQVQHLSIGHIWWTNTVIPHTAMNCSIKDRYHLVVEMMPQS